MNDSESPKTREHYWKAQVDAWLASGQSQQAFCKTNDLDYRRFGYWLRKFRRRGMVATAPRQKSGFVPVVAASAGGGLSVHLPNGIELHGVSERNLHVVEQLLARL
jgi:hypothetical protein